MDGNFIKINGNDIRNGADGFKAIFNLLYILVSDHQVILLYEPERFFHPSMKAVFISLLSSIAENYNKTIVVTSHSYESIRFDLHNVEIWLLKPALIDIRNWLNSLTHPAYSSAKDKQQFIDWLSHHKASFFSTVNCLLEGVSDQIIIESIRNRVALKYNMENISFSHVASSHHEAGGKSRLHKFQSFLSALNKVFVIADKDLITSDINKWYTPHAGESEAGIITNAKARDLHILSLGEIEDYYFIDASYDYCSSVARAKANKISAAYEQAGIISKKPINEIESQFAEVIDILKSYVTITSADDILKSYAKNYLLDKYGKNTLANPHISDSLNGDVLEIKYKFAGHGKNMKYPKDELEKIKDLNKQIDDNLK